MAAVVEGLSGFLGDMGKMDDSIRSLISPTNILGSVFSGLGNILSNVGGFIVNTLAHALGELLADAVQWVTTQIKELISATIEAGGEFQKLELRLNTLNFNDLTESEKKYTNAQEVAIGKTKEQLTWLQKLAATTPYDNADISNIYTLARGYSFADKDARGLVDTIVDFTSGMGLGNTEMVRIIKNLGQMQQLGKVTQRELNDLAVGAFVPVNKVLEKMRLETGLAGDEFDDFRNSGDGVASFLRHFTALVEGDFGGSAQKMARTFGAATDNLKDFIKSVVGLNVVKPILDVLGGRLADFMDELTSEDRWNTIVGLADRIGTSLSGIVSDIIGLAPDAKSVADAIVGAFEDIADWIDLHSQDIVNFVRDSAAWIEGTLVPAIGQVWDFLFGGDAQPGAIQKFGAWLKDDFLPFIKQQVIPGVADLFNNLFGGGFKKNGEEEFATDATPLQKIVQALATISTALPSVIALLDAVGQVIIASFGAGDTQTFAELITQTIIPAINSLTQFIKDNQAAFATLFVAIIALEVLAFIGGLIFSVIAGLTALVVSFGLVVAIVGIATVAFAAWKGIMWLVNAAVQALFLAAKVFALAWGVAITSIMLVIGNLVARFLLFKANVIQTFNEIITAIKNKDWAGAGKALVDGIKRGVQNSWGQFIALVKQLAQNALNTFNSVFVIKSPSGAMYDVGEYLVKGLAKGVKDSAGVAIKAMANTASSVMAAASPQMAYSPAITSPSQNTYSNTNNFSLNVNSSARTEPLISDFSMLQSLVGG